MYFLSRPTSLRCIYFKITRCSDPGDMFSMCSSPIAWLGSAGYDY